MRKQVRFICDKCRGPVWLDVESAKHHDMTCLYCGRRWFVKKTIYKKVVERELKRARQATVKGRALPV